MKNKESRLLKDEEIETRVDEYWDLYVDLWNEDIINECDFHSGYEYWKLEAQDTKSVKARDKEIATQIEEGLIQIFAETANPNVEFGESQWRVYAERMHRLEKFIAGLGVALKRGIDEKP